MCAPSHWRVRGRPIRATTVSGARMTRMTLRSLVRRSGLMRFRDMSGQPGRGRGRGHRETPEARRLLPAIAGATANELQPSPAAPRGPFLEALRLVRTPTEAPRPDPRPGSALAIGAGSPLPAAPGLPPSQPPPRALPPIQHSSPDAAERAAAELADLRRRLSESESRATRAEMSADEAAASAARANAFMQVPSFSCGLVCVVSLLSTDVPRAQEVSV